MTDETQAAAAPAKPARRVEREWWPTSYELPRSNLIRTQPPDRIITTIWADTPQQARRITKARKMGEQAVSPMDSISMLIAKASRAPGPTLPSEWFEKGDIPQALHAACWLGMVGLASGKAAWQDLLGDGGVIHALAHLNMGAQDDPDNADLEKLIRRNLGDRLRKLEKQIPGFAKYRD